MGEMCKTSQKYCQKCMYYSPGSSNDWCCAYYMQTRKRRRCKVGICDKFEPRNEDLSKERRRLFAKGEFDN